MKKVKAEIVQHMAGLQTSGKQISARFVFPGEFIGFQGHFPDKKVLPGVCQIQCAVAVVEQARQRKVALKEIALAKYFLPVLPDEEILCVCSDVEGSGEFTMKAVITKGTAKAAELKLRMAFTDEE